ncbi:glucose dehydrogenase [FAD, quinone]-like [Adelges cooleyi]|uniref:glucose dehydrogenase [FAD, quinone]-like n=1 Tax=Adelges cooleyi TaxID=133065 RepID=UPI00217F3673|nr:glucose dehydrogenase [FAD, quinone]-like [Adelges cooleyi]
MTWTLWKAALAFFYVFPAFVHSFGFGHSFDSSQPPMLEPLLSFIEESNQWERNEPKNQKHVLREYDFIVVGAGSAGAVVASRLSEIGQWNVLLIEAGEKATHVMDVPLFAPLLQATTVNWKYTSVPMNNSCLSFDERRCKFPRGKVMGGSSVLNFMIYNRGNRKDYDDWAAMGNDGWGYDQVLKYFMKSENAKLTRSDDGYHGKHGPLSVTEVLYRTPVAKAFVDAASQIGHPVLDINGQKQIGVDYLQVTMDKGRRWSTNTAFLFPANKRRNLHVKKYSTVTRVLIDRVSKTAVGVEFVTGRKKYRVYARKEVIVSAGAIGSPHLLLLSGIGPRAHLQAKGVPVVNDLPVGENMMDHITLNSLLILVNDTVTTRSDRLGEDPYIFYNYTVRHSGVLSLAGGTEALAFFDTDRPGDPDGHTNLELLLLSGSATADESVYKLCGLRTDVYDAVYRPIKSADSFNIFPMVMRPKSRGRIWLRDTDPWHQPLIDPNYFADETDLDVIVAGVRIVQRMLKTDAMRKLGARVFATPLPGCAHHPFDSDAYWKCSARHMSFSIYHLSGTCKMGPAGDPTAVVDPRLRVHGVKNLRVVDASIFPRVPAAHTNAPTIMVGEKAADMIKEDWGHGRDNNSVP